MQTSSTEGWTNYQNAFDSNDSTYATCGTATDYLQIQYDLPVYVAGFNATCNFASSVARACNLSLSTYDTDTEVLVANGIGGAETETYTTSATFDDTYMRTLRFKLINTTAGTAPTTAYPTRVKTINLAVDPDSKIRIKDLTDGQKDVITSYENRTGTWKKVKDTVVPEDYSTHELTHQNYYFVEKNKIWTQPVLTSNTSSTELIVSASSSYKADYDPWKSFKSNTTDNYCWCSAAGTGSTSYMQLEFSKIININNILVKNRSTTYSFTNQYTLQKSEDGETWIDFYKGQTTNYTALSTWTMFSGNVVIPKYLRIQSTGAYGEGYACIGYLTINANLVTNKIKL